MLSSTRIKKFIETFIICRLEGVNKKYNTVFQFADWEMLTKVIGIKHEIGSPSLT